jgi:hypothetical protein
VVGKPVYERRRGRRRDHLVNVTADPLSWYWHRGLIGPEQHEAGERLARLHRLALRPAYAANNLEITNGSRRWPGDFVRAGDALSDYNAAIRSMPDGERRVVGGVVCWGEFANRVAVRMGLTERSGIVLLRSGLDTLRAFWRDADG